MMFPQTQHARCDANSFLSIDIREDSKKSKLLNNKFSPGKFDVICQRGAFAFVGNRWFRIVVNHHAQELPLRRCNRQEKSVVVTKIIEAVNLSGGKFVRQDKATKVWSEVTHRVAREKVGHALREAHKERRSERRWGTPLETLTNSLTNNATQSERCQPAHAQEAQQERTIAEETLSGPLVSNVALSKHGARTIVTKFNQLPNSDPSTPARGHEQQQQQHTTVEDVLFDPLASIFAPSKLQKLESSSSFSLSDSESEKEDDWMPLPLADADKPAPAAIDWCFLLESIDFTDDDKDLAR